MTAQAGPDVRWIDALEEASGAAEAIAWLLRWDNPRIDGWLARVPPDPADLARFAGRADAGQRIVRRRLARSLLAEAAGDARLIDAPMGAVTVAAPASWHLSLASSGPRCAIAIGREPLGIDVEALVGDPLPPDLLTIGENARLASLPEDERLAASLACWTGKEAHSKRLGRPREDDPATIDTRIAGGSGDARSARGTSRLALRFARDWVATVALP